MPNREVSGLALIGLMALGAFGARASTVSASGSTVKKLGISVPISEGATKLSYSTEIATTLANYIESKPTGFTEKLVSVTDIFKEPPKVITNPEGTTLNPLTGADYIQPSVLYAVSDNVANNQTAVNALEIYDTQGFNDAIDACGDNVEARHAVILRWLGVYG
jgi:hypothetical protein